MKRRSWQIICRVCLTLTFIFIAGAISPTWAQSSGQKNENVCDVHGTLRRVDELLKLHRDAEAKLLLQRVEKCVHLSQIETFNIAWSYGRMHDFKTALRLFATVDADVPDDQTHAYAVAFGQFEMGDYPSVIKSLKAVQNKQALNPDCVNLLAVSYAKLGQYQDAYVLLRGQIQEHPQDLFSYLNLITLLTDAGQFAEAQKVATECVAVFPNNSEVFVVRGATETLLGQLDKARDDFDNAVKASPEKTDPRFFLALTDYKLSNYAAAAADLRSAMDAGVSSADLEYLLAECMLKLDPTKPTEALAQLDMAIRLDGNSVPSRTLRGKLLLEEGNSQKAVVDLEIAHKIDPTMRSATYNLARAYFAVGKQKEAQALYQQLQQQTTNTVNELSDRRIKQVLSGGP
ncbi:MULTISPECIES: tetratricopeptide repeat protein [Acidobacteriaceae]|uniref:tetratricopeptide repeat protein n=1 Tax=Acidobacteriaceae TaxID=204434 RepID=UPI00131BE92D|nr:MULTISPECIES: tetratricopeptide repeat protein [Acidobacteriaceae]MDW5265379.1 tetratricopeptide repeat protein [Edaphobacter sp.]